MSRSKKVDLIYFIFLFIFYFYFGFIFLFSIFRTTRVRVDWLRCHISHKQDNIVIKQITKLGGT